VFSPLSAVRRRAERYVELARVGHQTIGEDASLQSSSSVELDLLLRLSLFQQLLFQSSGSHANHLP
jgi:hypothetical protein